ncbi:MAG: RluA family pseudouridine synthase [Roseburia sp.]|nr:RluA family pseudouridine synthase [Roseburia sp.]MCM1278574.1 RluA family pseudouridine synthase [Robinsoniella sp.]
MTPRIIFEDYHILVVYKPSGMAVETARITETDLLSYLKQYLYEKQISKSPKEKGQAGNPPYLAMVHRLDQPVEGLLVFAKTPFAAKELSRQIQDNRMKKRYLAAVSIDNKVSGKPTSSDAKDMKKEQGSKQLLEDYLLKDGRTNTSRIVAKETKGAKKAVLFYELAAVREQDGIAVAEIELITGRHHQIRVQMAHAGMPLLGDFKYGDEASLEKSSRLQIKQAALCACQLEFFHPKTGKPLFFQIEPEKEIMKIGK